MASNDATRMALSDRVRSLRLNGRDMGERSRTRWLPWLISFVLLLTTIAFGYRAYRVGSLPTDAEETVLASREGTAAPPASASLSTTSVASTGEVVLQAKGYVIPVSLVQVSPKVGGQLIYIAKDYPGGRSFLEGTKFKVGEVLAIIEKVEYEAELKQAEQAVRAARFRYEELKRTLPEEIKQAEAELDEAKQTVTQQKLEMERNKRLMAGSAIAQREMEQTKYAYEATLARIKRLESVVRLLKEGRLQARLDTAEAEMKQAEATLRRAQWRYDNTEIKAPISGTILTKKAELGNIVNPSAFSSGISASICEMADLTNLEIDLSIQERDISNVKPGQSCWIFPEAYKDDREFLAKHPKGYRGRVSRLMPTADRAKGAVPVRVEVLAGEINEEEAGLYLRPDLSATVSFLRTEERSASDSKKTPKSPTPGK